MSSIKFLMVAVIALAVIPATVLSHHSRSEFADEVIELEGELVNVIWRNPHAALDIKVTNAQGEDEVWRIETFGSPNLFGRMGVMQDQFFTGQKVTVAGSVSERRSNYFLGIHVLLESGVEAVLAPNIEPRWTQNHVGGAQNSDVDLSKIVDAASEDKGIFRVWSITGRGRGSTNRSYPYTDETRQALTDWDPLEAPVTRCEPQGMPVVMNQPAGFLFTDMGDYYKLDAEFFGSVRTIHLADAQPPETQDPSIMGYSVGRLEGNTLIVETSRVNAEYFNTTGAPQSDQATFTERFTLSEDQTELAYRLDIRDSVTFTEPAFYERTFVALGEDYSPLDCNLIQNPDN